MAKFSEAHRILEKFEGGYSNRKNDRGGETIFGIARKFWPDWDGWAIVDALKSRADFPECAENCDNLRGMSRGFYEKEFWGRMRLSGIDSQAVANELFESGVNVGHKQVIKWAQRILGINDDGVVGVQTLSAINRACALPHGAEKLVADLNKSQATHYTNLIAKDPTQAENANGWRTRT